MDCRTSHVLVGPASSAAGLLDCSSWCSRSTFGWSFRSSWDMLLYAVLWPYISQYLTSGQQSGVVVCHCFVTLKLWRDQQVFALMLKRLWDWGRNRGLCATAYTLCAFRRVLHQEASCRMQKALVVKVKNGKWMKRRMAREKIILGKFSQYTLRDQ